MGITALPAEMREVMAAVGIITIILALQLMAVEVRGDPSVHTRAVFKVVGVVLYTTASKSAGPITIIHMPDELKKGAQ